MILMIAMVLLGVGYSAIAQTKTGKELSALTRDAIKQIPNRDLVTGEIIPAEKLITSDSVVEVSDMTAFCNQMGILIEDRKKFGQAFTLSNNFPIFINVDPTTGSEFVEYQKRYPQIPQMALVVAAMLYHEQTHARGERDEGPAYARELALLKLFESNGKFAGAQWASQYLVLVGQQLATAQQASDQLRVRMVR